MRIALIVSVQEYEDKEIVDLEKTAEDAAKLRGFVTEALPPGLRFEAQFLSNPKVRAVGDALKEIRRKLLETEAKAKQEGRQEKNLFLFFFAGHGFACDNDLQYLLCSDAYNLDVPSETSGGIGPRLLQASTEGLTNTDVVFWIDACRSKVLRDRGDDVYNLDKFRDVRANPTNNDGLRQLTINMCGLNQRAADDGLAMSLAIEVMRESLNSGSGILLDSTFTETLGERLRRRGRRQTPGVMGNAICLAPKRTSSVEGNSERILRILEYVSNGWKFYNDKRYSEAVKEAERALELDPTNAGALALKKFAANPPVDKPKKLPIDYVDSNKKEYRLIQASSFTMGSPLTGEEVVKKYSLPQEWVKYYDDAPQHKVTLTQDFYLAKLPVTRGEFKRFVEAENYKTTAEKKGSAWTRTKDGDWKYVEGKSWRDPDFSQTDDHPVVCISYDDALAYLAWLNKNAKPSPELNGFKPIYRLPTEAEWEYACRAGTQTEFFWGDEEKDGKGYLNAAGTEDAPNGRKWNYHFSFDVGYSATSPVGVFKPNPWGLYDMLGNVLEWTSDWYGDYPKGSVTDPKGAESGSFRALRGGGWNNSPANCRCAFRNGVVPAKRRANVGARVAFSLAKE